MIFVQNVFNSANLQIITYVCIIDIATQLQKYKHGVTVTL